MIARRYQNHQTALPIKRARFGSRPCSRTQIPTRPLPITNCRKHQSEPRDSTRNATLTRRPCLAGLRVVKNSVTLAERAASGVLSTQTHACPRARANRKQCFGKRPIERRTAVAHLRAPGQLAHHLRIDVEPFRYDGDLVRDASDRLRRNSGRNHFRAVESSTR